MPHLPKTTFKTMMHPSNVPELRVNGLKRRSETSGIFQATTYQQRPSIEQKWELEQSQSSAYLSGPMDWIKVPRDAFQHLVVSVPRCGKA
ncbi:UNVERIFIED_CONTAM: hypothetical protein FKN15_055151 [Acipenser sinensis]